MARSGASESKAAVMAEFIEAASALPVTALLPLLVLLGSLREQSPVGRTVPGSRRAVQRYNLLRRFAALKQRDPTLSNLKAIRQVNREARRIAPGLRCSVRSLQAWIQRYNSTVDGLAAGPAALVDRYGRGRSRPSKTQCEPG